MFIMVYSVSYNLVNDKELIKKPKILCKVHIDINCRANTVRCIPLHLQCTYNIYSNVHTTNKM